MAAPTIRGSTAPASGLAATSPAGTAIGDMVIIVTWERAGAGSPTHTVDTANGYVEIRSHAHDDGSTDGRLSVAYKIATSSGANSYTAYSTSGSGNTIYTGCIVLQVGTFTTLPSIASNSDTGTTNAAPNPPSVASLTGDYLVLTIAGWHLGSAATVAVGAPANYTETWEIAGSADVELSLATRALTGLSNATEDPGAFTDDVAPNGTARMTIGIRSPNELTAAVASSAASDAVVAGTFWSIFSRAVESSAASGAAVVGQVAAGVTTYERAAASSATSGADVAGTFFSIFERAAASSAATDAAAAGQRALLRAVASSATSGAAVTREHVHTRSAASSAASDATVVGQRDLLRAAAASAVSDAVVAGSIVGAPQTLERAAASSATADATVAGQRDVLRSASSSATSDATAAGQRELLRAAAASATSDASVAGTIEGVIDTFERSAASSATSGAAVSAFRIHVRAAASSATAASSVAHVRELLRAAAASGTADASVSAMRELLRQVAASATGAIDASGRRIVTYLAEVDASASSSVEAGWFKFRPTPQRKKHRVPVRAVQRTGSTRQLARIRRIR